MASPADAFADDPLTRAVVRAEVEARLFGGAPSPVRVGRYLLRGRLGSGGLGVVWLAWDPELQREVALKLLRADRSGGAEQDRQRMAAEARAMARVAHPNVVTVYDVGLHEGRIFLAMERVRGASLREWLRAPPADWQARVAPVLAAGEGLRAAHAAGLVHRDIKPENILMGEDGRARLTDFGLARAVEDATADGAGTPLWLAPELLEGLPATPASDQYALCRVAVEAIWGPLLPGAPFPAEPGLPRRAREALARGLSERPGDRWPTLEPLLQSLGPPDRSRWVRGAVAVILGIALLGAVLQMWMFTRWMMMARGGP